MLTITHIYSKTRLLIIWLELFVQALHLNRFSGSIVYRRNPQTKIVSAYDLINSQTRALGRGRGS